MTIDEYGESQFSHVHWMKEIGKFLHNDNPNDIIKFALAYTLQSIKAGEDFNRFKWSDEDDYR